MRTILCCSLLFLGCQNKSSTEAISDPVEESKKFAPSEKTPKPKGTNLELGLAGSAKVFCSALFVSGRQPEEAIVHSMTIFLAEDERSRVKYFIDQKQKSVRMTYNDTLARSATYYEDCGCIIDTADGLKFAVPVIQTTLPDANTMPWPMGDAPEKIEIPASVNKDSLAKTIEQTFEEGGYTAAFLIIYKGKIIAEKYMAGINKDVQLESWSMGKSLTATLVGRMIQEEYFSLTDPAFVPVWRSLGDPRGQIRIADLLQMSSGLQFTAHRDPETDSYSEYLDHFYIYSGGVDAFSYSYNRPLQYPVGSTGRYHNCDPLILGYIMKTLLAEKGYSYLKYPQKNLFDKIGIRKQILETDPYGNFLLTGFDYGTARNWGRLGMLYLQNGMWNGERLLPEGFSEFVSTPAPGWENAEYGGLFWLNGSKTFPIAEKHYYMAGAGGQYTIIIPDKELVVVRMGHFNGSSAGTKSLGKALTTLMNGIE